jgi:hypothetical protein
MLRSSKRLRRFWLLAAMALAVFAVQSTGSTARQTYGVSFSPLVGRAHTIFTATFHAPFEATGDSSWYELDAFGPPGCADVWASSGAVVKGEQTKLYLRRSDMQATPIPRAWCPGAYIANLEWWGQGGEKAVLISNFTFHVRGKAAPRILPQQKYGVRLSPREGGPRTVFIASFTAPFDAPKESSFYEIDALGPPGCAESGTWTEKPVAKGQKVTLRLGRSNVQLPSLGVRRWCPGNYIANLEFMKDYGRTRVLLGNFRIRVRSLA